MNETTVQFKNSIIWRIPVYYFALLADFSFVNILSTFAKASIKANKSEGETAFAPFWLTICYCLNAPRKS